MTKPVNSILIIDDDYDTLEFLSEELEKAYSATVATTTHSITGTRLAYKYLYDIILIDVNIDYRGIQYGGLEIYNHLMPRYGERSLIAYSQFISNDYLDKYDYNCNFILKTSSPDKFLGRCKTF